MEEAVVDYLGERFVENIEEESETDIANCYNIENCLRVNHCECFEERKGECSDIKKIKSYSFKWGSGSISFLLVASS